MNREIKFRAWDMNKKEMIHNIQQEYDGDLSCFGSYLNNNEFYETMQYTGLKDKNEKEIYERDIVKDWQGKLSYIKFEHGSFQLICIGEKFYGRGLIHTQLEVIGNIYENKNLLNGEEI